MTGVSLDAVPSLLGELQNLIAKGYGYLDAPTIGEEVFDLIDRWVGQFLIYKERHRHSHMLWIGQSWLTDALQQTPRMLFFSPESGCGKTRAMTVTRHLVPRPNHTADMSPGGLYISIEKARTRKGGRPTFLHDELDAMFGNILTGPRTNEAMRKLINAGHDREETLTRMKGNAEKEYQLFAPMALAGWMPLHFVPDTIRNRSVVIPMQRKLLSEKVVRWNKYVHPAEAAQLRLLLRYWVEFAWPYILDYAKSGRTWLPEDIDDRDADTWEPILMTGELIGGKWVERARVAAVAGVAAFGVRAVPSETILLLEDLKTVRDAQKAKGSKDSRVLTSTLLEELPKLSPRWRSLDATRLARLLSGYEIRPTEKRVGKQVLRGYEWEWFEDMWARYLPPPLEDPLHPLHPLHEGDDDE